MHNIIDAYINKLTKEDIVDFASKKNCNLSEEEVDFTYSFIKRNGKEIIKNPNIFDINRYQKFYSEENFRKIKQVYQEYMQKYSAFLR